jgi:hypothetical protein
MTETELIAAVEARTLPIEAFTHAEHVRLAWSYLRRLPVLDALATFRDALQGFAGHHGKATLYHETITVACMLMVFERMGAMREASWEEFAHRNVDLLTWKNGPFFQYYPADVLSDPRARSTFVLPQASSARRAA